MPNEDAGRRHKHFGSSPSIQIHQPVPPQRAMRFGIAIVLDAVVPLGQLGPIAIA
jgi:hypothetical protein